MKKNFKRMEKVKRLKQQQQHMRIKQKRANGREEYTTKKKMMIRNKQIFEIGAPPT
jgi:hypothetical protein